MEMNYDEVAGRAVAYAKKYHIDLDFTEKSIEAVDAILGAYFEHRLEYEGEDGADALWNIAVHFGIYLGETMLKIRLREKGYKWVLDDGLPVLQKDAQNQISPVTKAHKRILYGSEDSVKSFCDVAFAVANGEFPVKNVLRVVDVEEASGPTVENVLYQEIDEYIMLVEKGAEDFIILRSMDGFFQFYGVNNQFVAEIRVNFPNNDFRTYSIINKDKEHLTERITLITPYGTFTPTERQVVSLEVIRTVVRKYYENIETEDFLKEIPCEDTTEEIKRYQFKPQDSSR